MSDKAKLDQWKDEEEMRIFFAAVKRADSLQAKLDAIREYVRDFDDRSRGRDKQWKVAHWQAHFYGLVGNLKDVLGEPEGKGVEVHSPSCPIHGGWDCYCVPIKTKSAEELRKSPLYSKEPKNEGECPCRKGLPRYEDCEHDWQGQDSGGEYCPKCNTHRLKEEPNKGECQECRGKGFIATKNVIGIDSECPGCFGTGERLTEREFKLMAQVERKTRELYSTHVKSLEEGKKAKDRELFEQFIEDLRAFFPCACPLPRGKELVSGHRKYCPKYTPPRSLGRE